MEEYERMRKAEKKRMNAALEEKLEQRRLVKFFFVHIINDPSVFHKGSFFKLREFQKENSDWCWTLVLTIRIFS